MTDTRTLSERLEALDRAATPGPWFTLDAPWLPGGSETSILAGSPDPHVATFLCDFDTWALDHDDERKSDNSDADAAAIVTLRNALPEIIAALREREAWRAWYARATADDDCEYLNGDGWDDAAAIFGTDATTPPTEGGA